MANKDRWHYARSALARQVLGMFETGLSAALVFFAPRRMGKTEFLNKDMTPLAVKQGWRVFYFSFLDVADSPQFELTESLAMFAKESGILSKAKDFFKRITKISGAAAGVKGEVEFQSDSQLKKGLKDIVSDLANSGKVLLLLDEIQVLALDEANQSFVAALRTALDINKDNIKVIFTGSSREGLRKMFSKADAPFFHFGQNLNFPEFNKDFIEHLVVVFNKISGRKLPSNDLWNSFVKMEKVPQLIRSLVERVTLNPELSISQAEKVILKEIKEERGYDQVWQDCTALEKLLLADIAIRGSEIYSADRRAIWAQKLGVGTLPVSSIQSAVRTLYRKDLIGRVPDRGGYYIDDPNLKSWLNEQI